jgi:hypothetical protein
MRFNKPKLREFIGYSPCTVFVNGQCIHAGSPNYGPITWDSEIDKGTTVRLGLSATRRLAVESEVSVMNEKTILIGVRYELASFKNVDFGVKALVGTYRYPSSQERCYNYYSTGPGAGCTYYNMRSAFGQDVGVVIHLPLSEGKDGRRLFQRLDIGVLASSKGPRQEGGLKGRARASAGVAYRF